jgi:E3 ubiquitin-protein ligase SHPRH
MGLGKTVELLALMCANKYVGPAPTFPAPGGAPSGRPRRERVDCVCGADDLTPCVESYAGLWLQCDSCLAWQHGACAGHPRRAPPGDYGCGACRRAAAAAEVTQPCGTTLIVCPAPILSQWHSELQRHIHPGALKVVVYHGQPQAGKPSAPTPAPAATAAGGGGVVTAAQLASADVVLTTYDVLRQDLLRQPDAEEEQRTLRTRKRYEVVPTPLTRLRFWRVCLDEAQMVESSTARAAAMALRIQTVSRRRSRPCCPPAGCAGLVPPLCWRLMPHCRLPTPLRADIHRRRCCL